MDNKTIITDINDLEALLKKILNNIFPPEPPIWITEAEAMAMLNIKSKSHMWTLKTTGKLAYSQPSRKIVLIKRESVLEYLNKHEFKTF